MKLLLAVDDVHCAVPCGCQSQLLGQIMHWLSVQILLICIISSYSQPDKQKSNNEGEFHVDQSQWVDPGDMMKYDFASGMTEERGTQTTSHCSCPPNQQFDTPDVDCSKAKDKLSVCKKELALMSKIISRSDGNPKTDAFFRRLSIILINKLSEVQSVISSQDRMAIEFDIDHKFVDRVTKLQLKGVDDATPVASIVDDISDILIPLIRKSRVREQETFWYRHFDHVVAVAAAVCVMILVYLLLQRKMFVVMTISFVISVLWEWRRLYEEEIIRREVTLMSGPAQCRQSWGKFLLNGLASLFLAESSALSSDPCHKYYSSVGVKTILKCNPMLAVQNVIGMFFGGSFALMASYLGEATRNYFTHIPFIWYPFVGAAILVLLIFAMTFSFGYDVRVPFMSLKRSQRSDSEIFRIPAVPKRKQLREPATAAAADASLQINSMSTKKSKQNPPPVKLYLSSDHFPVVRRTQSLNQLHKNW
jgi:hypothetical protein